MTKRPVTNLFRFFPLLSLLLLLPLLLLLAAAPPAQAAEASQCDPARNLTFACLGEAVNVDILGSNKRTLEDMARNTGDLTMGLLTTFNVLLGGARDPTTHQPAYSFPPNPFIEGGGAIGALNQGIAVIYAYSPNRFADKDLFFKTVLANNLLNPAPAQAQGFGMGLLANPNMSVSFLSLWRLFRNIAYLALAAALAIFGLMVMFRAKADPRTTVTFQMALPRVAIALVLIYFSLPLAGLAMDIAEVGNQTILGFFCPMNGTCPLPAPKSSGIIWPLKADFGSMFNLFVMGQGTLTVNFGAEPFPGFNKLVELAIRLFAFSILLRVFWALISRYAAFLIQTLVGPLQILMGVFPGQEGGGTHWYRELLVSALTFPGIFLIINIANVFLNARIPLPTIIVPSGTSSASDISALLAIGVLQIAPKIPAMLEEMFDVVPGAHAARAGADVGSMFKGLPVVGRMMG